MQNLSIQTLLISLIDCSIDKTNHKELSAVARKLVALGKPLLTKETKPFIFDAILAADNIMDNLREKELDGFLFGSLILALGLTTEEGKAAFTAFLLDDETSE